MLERSKAIIDDAINSYVKLKTDRYATSWVAEKRLKEIQYIRETIFQQAKSTTDLISSLIVYITHDMHKGTEGLLPKMLLSVLHKSFVSRKETHQEKKQNAPASPSYSIVIDLLLQNNSKKTEEGMKDNKNLQQWVEKYHGETLTAMKKCIDDPTYFGLFNLLIGPPLFVYTNITSNQENLDARTKIIDLKIQSEISKAVYLVLKPYEEKAYRAQVFAKQVEYIEEKYQRDIEKIHSHLGLMVKGIAQPVPSAMVKAVTSALGVHTEQEYKAAEDEKIAALKKCEEVRRAFEKDSENIQFEETKLKMVHSSELTSEYRNKFAEYVKTSNIDEFSVPSSPDMYDAIYPEFTKRLASLGNDVADEFLLNCGNSDPNAKISDKFKESLSIYTRKRSKQYEDDFFEDNICDMKWESKDISKITLTAQASYNCLHHQVIRHFLQALTGDSHVKEHTRIEHEYRFNAETWLKEHAKLTPPTLKEDKTLVDTILKTNVGSVCPTSIVDHSHKNLMQHAMDNYRKLSHLPKHEQSEAKKTNALKVLLELVSRGGVINQSPSELVHDDKDYFSLRSAWQILEESLINTLTLSEAAWFIKSRLIHYCKQSIGDINSLDSFFSTRSICVADEKTRINKIFYLYSTLLTAFADQDDAKPLQALREIKKDSRIEKGLSNRMPLAEIAQDIKNEIQRQEMFCIDQAPRKENKGFLIDLAQKEKTSVPQEKPDAKSKPLLRSQTTSNLFQNVKVPIASPAPTSIDETVKQATSTATAAVAAKA